MKKLLAFLLMLILLLGCAAALGEGPGGQEGKDEPSQEEPAPEIPSDGGEGGEPAAPDPGTVEPVIPDPIF